MGLPRYEPIIHVVTSENRQIKENLVEQKINDGTWDKIYDKIPEILKKNYLKKRFGKDKRTMFEYILRNAISGFNAFEEHDWNRVKIA